jgi:glyoxylase-like metal-dependent hydrolase (beta-lactamase superfamily II)
MKAVFALILSFVLAAPAAAQIAPAAQRQPGRIYPVTENIHVVVLEGRNSVVLVGTDAVLLSESNFAERAQDLKDLIASVTPLPVKLVVNTHWHADHVGGNAFFAKAGAVTLAQENTRTRMGAAQRNRLTGNVQQQAFAAEFLPMITFKDATTVHFGGETIELTYYPDAHTDADTVLHFRNANVIFLGGLLNHPTYAGVRSADGFVKALDAVLAKGNAATKYIGWRGNVIPPAEVKEWRDILATTRDRVAVGIREGRSLDQIVASKPTRDFDAKWNGANNADNFVRQIYAGLTAPLD